MMKKSFNRNNGLYNSENTCPSFAGLDTQWSISPPYSAQSALKSEIVSDLKISSSAAMMST